MTDIFTVLNYQGSKKRLLNFIYENTKEYIDSDKAFLDICSGTSAVAYNMKRNFTVYTNDSENYAYHIANSIVKNNEKYDFNKSDEIMIREKYNVNLQRLNNVFKYISNKEAILLEREDADGLIELYSSCPCIWKNNVDIEIEGKIIKSISDLRKYKDDIPNVLFTLYYSSSYFGIKQSMDIDSIRYAIEFIECKTTKSILFTSLFFAMKECVFAKDGHMAQPLNMETSKKRMLRLKARSIYDIFIDKLNEFNNDDFVLSQNNNKCYNKDFRTLLETEESIKNEVGFIYIDPPYTDMQYSRYYHILNTVVLYDYPEISLSRGAISKGIYREGRYQSPLSQRKHALNEIDFLFRFCKENKINVALSYAYPIDTQKQATNRYTASIDDLINVAKKHFGDNVKVVHEEYSHANNRNSDKKNVLEYLIMGIHDKE
ncbi:DNA adenine methylase [Paraclostridium sordellii]|uniref:DNA adenine methylase n=1 Tax=Paraclostridium sordellii TaxID=1505 RepID=UPI0005DF0D8A|nr:DNA adenine methylase [Paeniclostridium sordellii]CEQ18974.1 Modification methylase FokI [[Clostridium] sordellii] [Paeniclostridium sordellii]